MVYWIEPLTLDQRVAGSIPVNAWHFLSYSKTLYPHCCSPPRCINGYPVGSEHYFVLDVTCVRSWSGAWPECSLGSLEGALWVQDWYWIQWPGVIIHRKALWIVSRTRKALYKNQLLLYFHLSATARHSQLHQHNFNTCVSLLIFFLPGFIIIIFSVLLFLFCFWYMYSVQYQAHCVVISVL